MAFDWKDRSVTITGAGGFVGSHLTEWLLERGAQVRAMVHGEKIGHLENILHDHLEIRGGDLCDATFVSEMLEGADTVFHLGAVTSVAYSYEFPEATITTNTLGTLNVCEAARQHRVRRLVHTSTAGVYGDADHGQPISEAHPVRGCNPYTAGKLGGDFTADTYYRSYDLPVCTIRLFNVYGPRVGEYLIIPTIIRQLMAGPEIRLGSLTPIRTFTYVDDLVRAFLLMAEQSDIEGETIHFGSENPISMQFLLDKIAGMMGVEYRLIHDSSRLRPTKSEINKVLVDITKAKTMLNWSPEISLDDGLPATIAWMRTHPAH